MLAHEMSNRIKLTLDNQIRELMPYPFSGDSMTQCRLFTSNNDSDIVGGKINFARKYVSLVWQTV